MLREEAQASGRGCKQPRRVGLSAILQDGGGGEWAKWSSCVCCKNRAPASLKCMRPILKDTKPRMYFKERLEKRINFGICMALKHCKSAE